MKIKYFTQIIFLFIKIVLKLQSLEFKNLSYVTSLLIEGNKTTLLWKVNGCFLVKIVDIGILPGNINCITVNVSTKLPTKIKFYGLFKTITSEIIYSYNKIKLVEKFETDLILPDIYIDNEELPSCYFEKPINLNLHNPRVQVSNISIALENFKIENYKT